MPGNERGVRANGVELCVETFGDAADPAILLIAGAQGSMLSWEDEFCERLASGARHVIRYDQRDTGRSVTYEPGKPGYTGRDLVDDAVAILDVLEVERAHVVGISAGGGVGQELGLLYPDRVASLTLISTSPVIPIGRELPPASAEILAQFVQPPSDPDWSNREAVVEYVVEAARAYAARSRPFDEEPWRRLAGRDFDRGSNIASSTKNHFIAADGPALSKRLGEIAAPTLVVHGTEDPLFPGHGEALAEEIPNAELLLLERTGHELPRVVWDDVVPAILRHTSVRK
jgi:pimeloyl-ACP methyl ester carboxylesterase